MGLVGIHKASKEVAGLVKLATQAEAMAGTDGTKAVTPAGMKEAIAAALQKEGQARAEALAALEERLGQNGTGGLIFEDVQD